MKRDLAKLYSELGLQPDCTLEEFNRTYRRRIAQLHPDRNAQDLADDARALPELIWLYATATRFHRRYGRLPGARPKRAHDGGVHRPPMLHVATPSPEPSPPPRAPPQDGRSDALPRRGLLMAILLLGLLLILALSWT